MQAMLLADQEGAGLAPLTEVVCPALLPVVDKPLVQHAVESLVAGGVDRIVVATSAGASRVEAALGDGTRFGVSIHYVLTRGEVSPAEVARRAGGRLGDSYLVARADVLRSWFVGAFLEECERHPGANVRALVGGRGCGLERVCATSSGVTVDVEMDAGVALAVDSLAAYHRAQLSVLAGRLPGVAVPGREVEDGVHLRTGAAVAAGSVQGRPVFIGAQCRVEKDAVLEDGVVLSERVVVDEGARLRRTVVLPDTYVGPGLDLEDAIVAGSLLVRVDSGAVARVPDSALVADMARPVMASAVGGVVGRALAGLLLVLSLPLWPLALLDAWRLDSRSVVRRRRVLGQRQVLDDEGRPCRLPVDVLELTSTVPLWRGLPGLVAVLRGDLALVGVRPRDEGTPEGLDEWARVRERAPVGLLGPGLLEPPFDATEDDRLLAEALYAETRDATTDLRWLAAGCGALLGRKAWGRRARVAVGATEEAAEAARRETVAS